MTNTETLETIYGFLLENFDIVDKIYCEIMGKTKSVDGEPVLGEKARTHPGIYDILDSPGVEGLAPVIEDLAYRTTYPYDKQEITDFVEGDQTFLTKHFPELDEVDPETAKKYAVMIQLYNWGLLDISPQEDEEEEGEHHTKTTFINFSASLKLIDKLCKILYEPAHNDFVSDLDKDERRTIYRGLTENIEGRGDGQDLNEFDGWILWSYNTMGSHLSGKLEEYQQRQRDKLEQERISSLTEQDEELADRVSNYLRRAEAEGRSYDLIEEGVWKYFHGDPGFGMESMPNKRQTSYLSGTFLAVVRDIVKRQDFYSACKSEPDFVKHPSNGYLRKVTFAESQAPSPEFIAKFE